VPTRPDPYPQAPEEEQARRQLESGRSFARQGNYAEAIRDFRAVADTYGTSSVADNALLEMARYYLDIAGDLKETSTAVETILRKYPTSDSAPEAILITGRLAMSRSHQTADLDTALANFDRVSRLFPNSDVVPRSLVMAGEALWYAGRYDDALASLVRAEVEYPGDAATAHAHLNAARVMVSRGDPIGAMEELQQVRNRWPGSPEADDALGRLTILHRLHVRGRSGAPYALTAETPGPPKLQNVVGLGATRSGAIYWAAESGFGLLSPAKAAAAPTGTKSRGLAIDALGNLVAIETGGLRPFGGQVLALPFPRQNQPVAPLAKIDAAVQLFNGEWLVADDDARGIQRFSKTGEYVAAFSTTRVSRLAVNARDEMAGLDRDQKGVVFFDAAGNVTGRIPAKGAGYDVPNLEDLAFDQFGYLYLLDRASLAVFSPVAGAQPGHNGTYKLVAVFSEPATNPNAFRRATAFALDRSGGLYLYDERDQRVRVYR
jgi:TolA-binding protein